MTKIDSIPEALCHHCGRPLLFGRSDRKFCNDTCRNTFNRELRKKKLAEESIPDQIIKLLKKNYALLLRFNPSQNNEVIVDRYQLHKAGYAYNYFTGRDQLPDGEIRYRCFDQCWVDLEYGLVKLGVIEPDAT